MNTEKNGNGKSPINLADYKKQMTERNAGRKFSAESVEASMDAEIQSTLRQFEEAVRQHPEVAHNWFNLGDLLLALDRNPEAESALREALSREPESVNYRYQLGNALSNNGKLEEAVEHLKHLAEIDPELRDPMSVAGLSVLKDLSYCMGEMGNWKEAMAVYRPVMGVLISILDDLARFSLNLRDHERARAFYSIALFFTPGNPSLLHGAGHNCLRAGWPEEALPYLQKARRLSLKDPDICYDLGLALTMVKKGKEARPWFQKALKLEPGHVWAWYDLACLDAIENKPAAAFRKLFKSVECGFRSAAGLKKDPNFKSLHNYPKWEQILDCIADKTKLEEVQGDLE